MQHIHGTQDARGCCKQTAAVPFCAACAYLIPRQLQVQAAQLAGAQVLLEDLPKGGPVAPPGCLMLLGQLQKGLRPP